MSTPTAPLQTMPANTTHKNRTLLALVSLVAAASLFATACAKVPATPAVDSGLGAFLPAGIGGLVSIRVSQIMADAQLAGVVDSVGTMSMPSPTAGSASARVQQMTGIDPTKVNEVLVAVPSEAMLAAALDQASAMSPTGTPSGTPTHPAPSTFSSDELVLVQGTFDSQAVLAALQASAKTAPVTSSYDGQNVYSYTDGTSTTSLAFLSTSVLVTGTQRWVDAAIDVKTGKAAPLTGPLADNFSKLGSPLFKAYALLPGMSLGSSSEGPTGTSSPLAALTAMQAVSLTIDRSTDSIVLSSVATYADAATAQAAAQTIRAGAAAMASKVTNPTAKLVLSNAQITQSSADVHITSSLNIQQLQSSVPTPGPTPTQTNPKS